MRLTGKQFLGASGHAINLCASAKCVLFLAYYTGGRRGRGQTPNPNFWKTMNKCFFIKGTKVFHDCVLGGHHLLGHICWCLCISVDPDSGSNMCRGWGPLRGAVSAQEALQGSETETRELLGGTEEISISLTRIHWFDLQANQWFFTKRKQKKKI